MPESVLCETHTPRRANKDDLASVLDAFSQWINRCLIEGRSIFSTHTLWTPATIEEARSAFVDHQHEGKDDFSARLKRQTVDASSAAKQLMGEMMWALLLFSTNIKPVTKREQVRDLLALRRLHGLDGHSAPRARV